MIAQPVQRLSGWLVLCNFTVRGGTTFVVGFDAGWHARLTCCEECKKLLQENRVKLITWREVGSLLKKPAN